MAQHSQNTQMPDQAYVQSLVAQGAASCHQRNDKILTCETFEPEVAAKLMGMVRRKSLTAIFFKQHPFHLDISIDRAEIGQRFREASSGWLTDAEEHLGTMRWYESCGAESDLKVSDFHVSHLCLGNETVLCAAGEKGRADLPSEIAMLEGSLTDLVYAGVPEVVSQKYLRGSFIVHSYQNSDATKFAESFHRDMETIVGQVSDIGCPSMIYVAAPDKGGLYSVVTIMRCHRLCKVRLMKLHMDVSPILTMNLCMHLTIKFQCTISCQWLRIFQKNVFLIQSTNLRFSCVANSPCIPRVIRILSRAYRNCGS